MKYYAALLISIFSRVAISSAQDIEQLAKADPVAWNGGLTWSNIFTWPKDSAKQVPTYSYYISGSLNTTIFGVVGVPISFAYTNNKLSSTVTYPFNRFTLTPSYKWIKLHIGYSQMTFSPYTMAGHDFLGGGVELTPDDSRGSSRRSSGGSTRQCHATVLPTEQYHTLQITTDTVYLTPPTRRTEKIAHILAKEIRERQKNVRQRVELKKRHQKKQKLRQDV
ncbi:MAG: hypothetical protein II951_01485 [Bacteroidales bacterium]|nr:hypothetical protein [Bacteroidales bacterium]